MASADEVYEGLCIKVERAYKHLHDLAEEMTAFDSGVDGDKTRPYAFSHKDDAQTGERTFYVHFLQTTPSHWPAVIGDILQNLRSALDHLATHLVDIGHGPKTRMPYFPCFETSQKYEAGKMGKIEGARPEAIKEIDATEPYAGGHGHNLWLLHTLNNRDKHRLLIPVWTSLSSHSFGKTEKASIEAALKEAFPGGLSQSWLKNARGPVLLKDGDPVLTMPISELQEKMCFRILIAFQEPDLVRGRPVIPTLNAIAIKVSFVLRGFYEKGLL